MSGQLKLNTPSAGSVTLSPADTASNVTVTIPAATATLVDASSTQTLTSKTLTAAGGNAVEATSGPTSTQLAGMRNKIINGAMMIDQRNAGASLTPANNAFIIDRWAYCSSQASKFTAQQNQGSVTPPAGAKNYLGVTSSSSYSVTSTDYFFLVQRIEGLNCADLNWGTASAQSVSVSFKVYSSLTGTFGALLSCDGDTRTYPFSYTISSANTWTTISVTIPGDTSGTWLTTNGVGINLMFSLGAGSSRSGTSGAWVGSAFYGVTGQQNVVGTNGATFYITGVQLEAGSTATPFENRQYGTELALCQRYYETSFSAGTAPNHNTGELAVWPTSGSLGCGGNTYILVAFKVTKRSSSASFRFFDPNASHTQTENWVRVMGSCSSGAASGPNPTISVDSNQAYMYGYMQVGTDVALSFNWTASCEL